MWIFVSLCGFFILPCGFFVCSPKNILVFCGNCQNFILIPENILFIPQIIVSHAKYSFYFNPKRVCSVVAVNYFRESSIVSQRDRTFICFPLKADLGRTGTSSNRPGRRLGGSRCICVRADSEEVAALFENGLVLFLLEDASGCPELLAAISLSAQRVKYFK